MEPLAFRTTDNFERAAAHLQKYHGISRELASKRLHGLKRIYGFGGADNVIFDFSGGVYNPISLEALGTLTAGGAREKA